MNFAMNEASKSFQELINEEWEYRLKEYPMFATHVGDHRYDNTLDQKSEQDYERRLQYYRTFKARLDAIPLDNLEGIDKQNYQVFDFVIHRFIRSIEFKSYRIPLSKVNGFHLRLPELYSFMPFKTIQDYKTYIARLEAIPAFIDQNIELMKSGLQSKYIPAKVTLVGVADAFDKHTNKPEDNRFFTPFKSMPESFNQQAKNDLVEEAKNAINNSLIPAYKKMSEFLTTEYIPKTREDISAKNLPNGEEYYQYCIWHYTSLTLTPKEVHEIGLGEVTRIRNEMDQLLKKINYQGTIKEFIQFLRTDPQFYVSSAQELLQRTAYVNKKIDGQLPTLFKTLPRLPYGVKPIPDYAAPGNYTAYYQPGSGDGTKSGTYYVNTYDLKSRPIYEIESLSMHESVPGHHLQIALQYELDLPNFRKHSDFTSFVEGWALYTEDLGFDIGFYTDPYSNFGRLSYDMWRACRLVVDTGMHAFGWTRQQAVDFMAENSSLSLLNITNEVDRYISWPGQSLAYKLGQLKIKELRKKAETKLKEKFDIRTFHDAVLLNGSLPLALLEKNIDEYISQPRP